MSDRPVRVRFAPSPTGYLHIGGARTALLTWLLARSHDGTFILRIEDTDQKRYNEDATHKLMEDLRWLGLDWDEGPEIGGDYGPYIQSQRLDLYQKWANWLVEQGKAYRCYATQEELARAREIAQKTTGKVAGYERMHRYLSDEERAKLQEERGSYVIRFAMPLEGKTEVYDRVRGKIVFNNAEQNDAVLLKSDGFPTYHLAMAVDDHFMEISHVTRTEEWIPSAGLHQQLYQAFGWEPPEWVHMPVILNPNGKGKMSKRNPPVREDGTVIPVLVHDYREAGYLPDAMVNFLTNIGWSFGDDREVFDVQETLNEFTISRISPSSGAFPVSKLDWINGVYIRQKSTDELADLLLPFLERVGYQVDREKLAGIVPHIQERLKTLQEAAEWTRFLWIEEFAPAPPEDLIPKKLDAAQSLELLRAAYATLRDLDNFGWETQEAALRALAKEHGVKAGQLFNPLRVATTAQQVAPPLFQSMEVLGREETLRRIQLAIAALERLVEDE
ncbi:MAG: glutamate--tRNA ligase [Chloroflexi bacterium]|nr:glutamate--tRNA ligase [Chloroflexota bacterium]